jgi:hypothetical protein
MGIPTPPEVIQVSSLNIDGESVDVSTIKHYDGRYETCVFWSDPKKSRVIGIQMTLEAIETLHLETIHKLITGEITKPE